MAKVGIVMGSDSDMPVMAKAAEILDKLGKAFLSNNRISLKFQLCNFSS